MKLTIISLVIRSVAMWNEVKRLPLANPYYISQQHLTPRDISSCTTNLPYLTGLWGCYTRFYDWFKASWNTLLLLKINGEDIPQDDRTNPVCYDEVKHLFITKTRASLG